MPTVSFEMRCNRSAAFASFPPLGKHRRRDSLDQPVLIPAAGELFQIFLRKAHGHVEKQPKLLARERQREIAFMADDFLSQAREILARVLRRKLCNEAALRTLREEL